MKVLKDFSLSAVVAGLVTVLVGVSSSAVIVFQAARALGASDREIGSWMWALGLGIGITSMVLSWRWRIPVVTAWSTPGAAMILTATAGTPMSMREATGAFLISAALCALAGFSGIFEKLIRRVPVSLASGMLAGVLLNFGLGTFQAIGSRPGLVLGMIGVFLILKRLLPRYAIVAVLAVGVGIAAGQGILKTEGLRLAAAHPVWTTPSWSAAAAAGIALPLFLVTMASQNVPGVAVMRAAGYELPVSRAIGSIGVVNLALAPFGGFALNLAAITAAICVGSEAHADPKRRYVAAMVSGAGYAVVGFFGATVTALFAAFPKELVATLGLALLGTIGSSLASALQREEEREPALIAFLVTASGLSLHGIGSAFWGLAAGGAALLILRGWRRI